MLRYGVAAYFGDARQSAQVARLAEQAGWDGFFVGDAVWNIDTMVILTAAAMTTSHIRLGTMVTPVPLRKPWKLASESAAIDNLSGGRMILGLGTGAVWMGWQGFPDEITDTRARAEMLDETIDILNLLYKGKPFDYDGQHYHLKLTQMDEIHYPPPPAQKPRIPLWAVGVWPRMKSMRRVLKCDGLLAAKMNAEGKFEELQPTDIREIKAYIEANRSLSGPFDIIVEGQTGGLGSQAVQDKLSPWAEAGATWWIEGLWGATDEERMARIMQGPPRIA
jgi:alkanesulfonate monooxygenase SsuD/methylene tetrahydromethanopterin reductase-like flavin-dependent oxidoreductase (luciferase family)